MIAFLDNNLRHHEGVAAVGPCDGLGPAAVVKELPAGCVGVVNGPVDLERLAGIRVFRLVADDIGGDGDIAALVVLDDQAVQVEGLGIGIPVVTLSAADGPAGKVIAFLDNNLRHHEGVAAVRPCDGFSACIAVVELPLGSIGIVNSPVDFQRFAGIWVFRLAPDADGFGGLQAPGLVSGIPKQDDGVNLGLADCGRVRTGDQAIGGVILFGVLRRDRGDLIGVLPVFSKGYVLCGFIATFYQSKILIAMVNGTCVTVRDQDRVLNGCQVVRSGDSRLCNFEMGGKGIHGAAGGRFQCIVNLFTV